MNRDTVRAIIAAAALMTAQALLLAALAASGAHASTVYRCQSAGASVSYQTQPCGQTAGTAVRVADARTPEQQRQAQTSHARQMAWLDRQETQAARPKAGNPTSTARKRTGRRQAQATKRSRPAATLATPLTAHRIGQRPFEGHGQRVTPPDNSLKKPGKGHRSPYEVTARTPKPPALDGQAGRVRASP